MKHLLNEIKSQLFGAPADVKASFNTIVQYFAQDEINEKLNSKYFSKDAPTTVKGFLIDIINGLQAERDRCSYFLTAKGKISRYKGKFEFMDPGLVAKEAEAYDIAIKTIEEALKKVK